jgi:predicted MFS family arabinose efflux permease
MISYRWFILVLFLLLAGLSQMLWLNFAPLLSDVQNKYQVGEGTAGLLLLVFPLIYVVLSIPAGLLTDRKGYRFSIGLGSIMMSLGACLRIYESSFWILLIAQSIIAIGQPYIVNGISKLVLDWFSKEQSAIATGIGTMGMFIGMAAGLAVSRPLIENIGYSHAMMAFAGITVVCTVLFLLLAKNNPDSVSAVFTEASIKESFIPLFKNQDLLKVFLVAFLGLGFFNGLTTWIEPILAPNGIDALHAGNVGGILILGGILGAIVIPALSDYFKKRKPFIVGSIGIALLTLYPLCTSHDYLGVLKLSALQGFFFLPAFALLLEACAELSGERFAGAATGILMLAGNAGGVIVILAMEAIKGNSPTFYRAVLLMLVLLVIAVVTTFTLPETYGRKTSSS